MAEKLSALRADRPLAPGRFLVLISVRGLVGRAVAQAINRWFPTAAARVRVRAACRICGGQSGIGAGFLRVLRFPLPIIPPISPSS
jgi:ribosomal protein S14